MDLTALPSAVTQILYLTIAADADLTDDNSKQGKIWSQALDSIEASEGYQRLHWGRSVEQPDKVQLHIVRTSLSHHQSHLSSSNHTSFLDQLRPLLRSSTEPGVRHVTPLTIYTAQPTDPFHAPVTGTAIYLSTSSAWHEGAWPCWTHVVRHVKGCTGISGGRLLEPVSAKHNVDTFAGISSPESGHAGQTGQTEEIENCYLVYVGWDSIKDHSVYHHTKHFRDHSVILTMGHQGWREYGHIKFEGWRGETKDGDSKARQLAKL